MFGRMIDDFKASTGTALRLTSLMAAMALALFIAIAFLCAAAFVYVLKNYGLIQACLTGAAVFLFVALIAAIAYTVRKNRVRKHVREAKEGAKSAMHSALADPMLVAAGLQVVRAIGIKKLIPILAIGAVALGYLASRGMPAEDETPAE